MPLRRATTPTVSQSSGKVSALKVSRAMNRLFPSASRQRMSPFFGWQVSTFTPSTLISFVSSINDTRLSSEGFCAAS